MGRVITSTTYRKARTPEELISRFAQLMYERHRAASYLFGSRARGESGKLSDYDVVAVSEAFRGTKRTSRMLGRPLLWLEAGGWGEALDLHCFTPEEFRREIASGMGYLWQAHSRGELIEIPLQDKS
jgi:predicted nucleotidyltransferase